MGAVDYNNHVGTNVNQHNAAVFDAVNERFQKLTDRIARERTRKMLRVMRFRRTMEGEPNSRYPKHSPKSNKSYTKWQMKRSKSGMYTLYNDARNPNDGYPYVRNLAWGTGWSNRVRIGVYGGFSPNLVLRGTKIFSKQMPNGLAPWLRLQKKHMGRDIGLAIDALNKKGVSV
jgi:hypothetical protein